MGDHLSQCQLCMQLTENNLQVAKNDLGKVSNILIIQNRIQNCIQNRI